ncbi:MAG: solute:sodium symporter family transporter [Phycisphaeraceae bacterium]|nr:solute:sodium symporter family transporter [Phycisphaeraceae bacterium]
MTILISFLLFTGLVAGLTWALTHKDDHGTSEGFFLAGRKLGAVVIAGSLLLTNLSTEQLVGLNGDAYAGGLHVMVWEIVTVIAIVLMALFFLPRFLRSGVATVPQFLEDRFGPTTRAITTLVFLAAYAVVLLPMILYTGAQALSEMFDVQALTGIQNKNVVLWLAVWIIGLIGSVYALFGGLRTVAVSDTLNGAGLLIGGLLITYFGLQAVGGDGGAMAGLDAIRTGQADRLNSIGARDDLVPFETIFTGAFLLMTFYWCTNQQIIQRTLAARDLKTGQKGVLLCGAVKLLGPIYLVLPGLIAYQLFANNPVHEGMAPAESYGRLVREVLPAGLTGFFAAVVVGAILSSFNSALNSATTLFSLGIYQPQINKHATEKQVVASGKWFGWVTAVVAMTIAPLLAGQESIFGFLQAMNAIYFIPILSVVVIGMLTKRVPGWSANVALVLGVGFLLIGNFLPIGTNDQGGDLLLAGGVMHNFHYVGLVFVSLVALMLVARLIKPRPEPWAHEHSKQVDITPWKFAVPAGIALVIAVIVIYAVFADFTVL